MKAWQFLLVIALSVGAALAVVRYVDHGTSASAQHETVYQRVIRTGTIRCGYGISPPRLVQDPTNKVLSGFDHDVWQQIGTTLSIKIDWSEEAGWGGFIEGLRDDRYDAFCSSMFPDPARIKFLSLTTPTMYATENAYVRADDHRFDGDLEKLNDSTVTLPVIDGDVSATASGLRFPKAKLLTLPQTDTVSDMYLAVTMHKADAIFLDPGMFSALDKSNPGTLRKLENVPSALTLGTVYGFAPGETQLRDMVSIGIRQMIDNGSMERLEQQYSLGAVMPAPDYPLSTK